MTKTHLLRFDALAPIQSPKLTVFTFVTKASEIARIARIERAGRDDAGALQGFQRPQIANHIREIRDYLEKPNSILPNAIVVAFIGQARLARSTNSESRVRQLIIDTSNGPPGWIVDGQQRFTALSELRGRDFEVLVSGFLCETEEELQKQFILVNNTRPLPKALVYELLPQVGDLPPRMSSRSQAALVTEALNYRKGSSLKGLIKQQTNPKGVIRDTVLTASDHELPQRRCVTAIRRGKQAVAGSGRHDYQRVLSRCSSRIRRRLGRQNAKNVAAYSWRRDCRDGLCHGFPQQRHRRDHA